MPIGASPHPMAALSGFYKSHRPTPSGDAWGITGAPPRPSKWSAKWTHFAYSFCLLSPWRPPRRYGASSHPMAVFSGFYESPGHAALGDAACTASTPPHGHQNGLQRRCICSSPPVFLLGIIVAKDHVMVHLN